MFSNQTLNSMKCTPYIFKHLARTTSKLADFSTCEISDALIKLKAPHGGYIPDINMLSPSPSSPSASNTRLCGPAYTVRMVMSSDVSAPKLSEHYVDTIPEGSVIVISASPKAKNAVWGGLMTAGAKARSAKGVIISGRCRDLSEQHSQNFPVFARGHSTVGQSPFTRPSEINVPVVLSHIKWNAQSDTADEDTFPGLTVHPGDWIVADEDGVVCVPRVVEDEVIELAKTGRHIDDLCMKDIRAGKGVKASFYLHRGR